VIRVLALVILVSGGLSCATAAGRPSSTGQSPLAWRLVEAPAPGGRELVLEAYDPTAGIRIALRFARELASIGEVVEAEVSLPESTGLHRLEILPDREGVSIVGPREVWVDGPKPVTVRFTCAMPGRGGVTVLLKE
jgi:hypothetical protein